MSQIRDETPVRYRSRNGMAVDASGCLKNPAAFTHSIVRLCWFCFFLDPLVKLFPRINVDAQEHFGMLHPPILGALPDLPSTFMRINHIMVTPIRIKIRLSPKTRTQKAVSRAAERNFQKV